MSLSAQSQRTIDWSSLSDSDILDILLEIDPYDFEHLVADLWETQGWRTIVSQASNDMGIDIEARKSNPIEQTIAIQVKRYNEENKIGRPEIQQYSSLKHQRKTFDLAAVITTSSFTDQAVESAENLEVKTVDGFSLARQFRQNDAYHLIAKYVDIDQLVESGVLNIKHIESNNTSQQTKTAETPGRTSSGGIGVLSFSSVTIFPISAIYTFQLTFRHWVIGEQNLNAIFSTRISQIALLFTLCALIATPTITRRLEWDRLASISANGSGFVFLGLILHILSIESHILFPIYGIGALLFTAASIGILMALTKSMIQDDTLSVVHE